jgi:hypothetical protein
MTASSSIYKPSVNRYTHDIRSSCTWSGADKGRIAPDVVAAESAGHLKPTVGAFGESSVTGRAGRPLGS